MKNHTLRGLLIIGFILLSFGLSAQIITPVKWSFSSKQLNPGEVELIFRATIDKTWHLYSQETKTDGPLPTTFIFEESNKYQKVGKVSEPAGKEEYDPVFEMEVKYFNDEAIFKQKIKVLSKEDFILKGVVEFQACDDKACIFDDEDFEFKIKGNPQATITAPPSAETSQTAVPAVTDTAEKTVVTSADTVSTKPASTVVSEEDKSKDSLWGLFILSFLAGLAAILTPCVFPMIPMTVTFFLKEQDKVKAKFQAIIYGVSIIAIYTVIGTLVAVIFGANFANF